jgi:hypothetical protein
LLYSGSGAIGTFLLVSQLGVIVPVAPHLDPALAG